MRDFSADMYVRFLQAMDKTGYQAVTVRQWCAGVRLPLQIVLRHDVDRFPERALALARAEAEQKVYSTYYFRYKPFIFKESIVKNIADLGHEVGYHYEVLSDTGGDPQKARELFAANLAAMRRIVPVHTAAMHGRPLSRYTETCFWENCSLEEFHLEGEAYLSFHQEDIPYLNDTGRTWHKSRYNLRDALDRGDSRDKTSFAAVPEILTTPQLIGFLASKQAPRLYLSFHPERWPTGIAAWLGSMLFDVGVNQVKGLLRYYHAR